MATKNTFTLNPPTLNAQGNDQHIDAWKPLTYLNIYRTALSAFFLFLAITEITFHPLGSVNEALFTQTSLYYLVVACLFWMMIQLKKPNQLIQIHSSVLVDCIAILLLMHASGGIQTGLGTLLLITVAGNSMIVPFRSALYFAALATITLLGHQLFSHYIQSEPTSGYTYAGILGVIFFSAAIISHKLSIRIKESEALAVKRGVDLANMAQLTEHIIQRMQTGILVIDNDNDMRLINESAWHMLGMPSTSRLPNLSIIVPELVQQVEQWRKNSEFTPQVIRPTPLHANVMPRFAKITQDNKSGILIFLEDTSVMAQQAQHLQLAALGRLTASIAHEIRNPLGAISHAGQLLEESANLDKHDKRLTQIIFEQSARMNTIIENIMQLGRRDHSRPEVFELKKFLQTFVNGFIASQHFDKKIQHLHANEKNKDEISIDIKPAEVKIRFDISHLEQILTNLCENGLRHSKEHLNNPKIELRGGITPEFNRPFLDIIDHGSGMTAETAQHIFEPFFTTEPTGSGLGLYISRELTECNQARMNYIPVATGGSCFRITFQDPRRSIS